MLSFAAAAWAPLRIRSQNVSPGAAWVTRATVIRGVVALPAAASVPPASDFFPPEPLEQPAASRAPTATAVVRAAALWCLRMSGAPHCAGTRGPCPVREAGGGWAPGAAAVMVVRRSWVRTPCCWRLERVTSAL
ncbi:hypothetical protein GCM10010234_15240 [Streptomyces hawaiiensis]